jgi:hypothetical protein
MASERAMVAGFCGSISLRPALTAALMGLQPVAWAPKNFTLLASTRPSSTSSRSRATIWDCCDRSRLSKDFNGVAAP